MYTMSSTIGISEQFVTTIATVAAATAAAALVARCCCTHAAEREGEPIERCYMMCFLARYYILHEITFDFVPHILSSLI